MEAMWKGTKDLITRSKFGQMPRLLLRLVYRERTDFYIGELDQLVKWTPKDGLREEEVRDVTQGVLEVGNLLETIGKYQEKIERVEIAVHERLETEPEIVSMLEKKLGNERVLVLEELA